MNLKKTYHRNRGTIALLLGLVCAMVATFLGAVFATLDWSWIVHCEPMDRGAALGFVLVLTLLFALMWNDRLKP